MELQYEQHSSDIPVDRLGSKSTLMRKLLAGFERYETHRLVIRLPEVKI